MTRSAINIFLIVLSAQWSTAQAALWKANVPAGVTFSTVGEACEVCLFEFSGGYHWTGVLTTVSSVFTGCQFYSTSGATSGETQDAGCLVWQDNIADDMKLNGDSCQLVGNPINPANGNKYLEEVDIEDSSPANLTFVRRYNSKAQDATNIGTGWRTNFDRNLVVKTFPTFTLITATRPNGQVLAFNKTNNGWLSDKDIYDSISEELDQGGAIVGWNYTTADNTVEFYDATGKLLSVQSINGALQSMSYDIQGRLDRVDSSTGAFLLFSYDTTDRISSVTNHASQQWQYNYDSNGSLEFVEAPDGSMRQYHYEHATASYLLTGITDERGIRYSTYEYDEVGSRAEASYLGPQTAILTNRIQGVSVQYSNNDRTLTNSNGITTDYSTSINIGVPRIVDITGPGCSTCSEGNTGYDYDSVNNNLLSRTENGVTTQYGNYNLKGQPGYRINAAGTSEQSQTDYIYDARFHNKTTIITTPSVFTP